MGVRNRSASDEEKIETAASFEERNLITPDLHDDTHRQLKNRHVQLIGIGGAIGTLIFVQIGSSLAKGGPGSLFLAFTLWCTVIVALNNCLAEMVTWMPISAPFVRFADHFVDPAFGFSAGYNYLALESFLIPFEITAFNIVLRFWTDKIPTVAVVCIVLFLYGMLNVFAVRWFGESEYWLALGKVILATGLIVFTIVVMLGGNPAHDRFGFRYWKDSNIPGAPFAEYIKPGTLGQFLGFLACLIQASVSTAGPDYVSMAAGEARNPRKSLPKAYSGVLYRLLAFFVLGSLCVGIIIPYNDPVLLSALSEARPGAGSSPYVIAMQRLHIKVLPHIVNALILTSVFSAGNSYVYTSSRTLLGLALEGKAPRILTKCTSSGVPVYCVAIVLVIGLLSFLQVSNDSAIVLQWFINLVTASTLLNYGVISFTYLRFYKAMRVQGISRDILPYVTFWQPFCGYYALIGSLAMALAGGYTVFLPGRWSVPDFLFSYTMIGVMPLLFLFWKIIHKSKRRDLSKIRFFDSERKELGDDVST